MSDGDVHPNEMPNEMNAPHDFDDAAAEALVSEHGHDVDAPLADVLADMRVAYTSKPPALGAELSALITHTPVPDPAFPPPRRSERMRSSLIAKVGAAAATLLAATGGLAVAHALPTPVQDAASHLGIGTSAHHRDRTSSADDTRTVDPTTTIPADPTTVDPTPTTTPGSTGAPGETTPTTTDNTKDHGNGTAVGNHDGNADADADDNSCGDNHDSPEPRDGTGAPTVPTTPNSTVPCVPTTDTTTPEPHDGHNGKGDSHDNSGDSNTTVTSFPSTDAHGGRSDSGGRSGSGGGN